MEDLLNFSFGKKEEDSFTEEEYQMMYEIFKKEIEEDNRNRSLKNNTTNVLVDQKIIQSKILIKYDIENITNYQNLKKYINGKVEINCNKLKINKEPMLYEYLKQKLNLMNYFDYPQYIVKIFDIIQQDDINISNEYNKIYMINNRSPEKITETKHKYIDSLIQFGEYFMLNKNQKMNYNEDLLSSYYKEEEELRKLQDIDQYILFYKDIKDLNKLISKNSAKIIFDNCVNDIYKKLYEVKAKRLNLFNKYFDLIFYLNKNHIEYNTIIFNRSYNDNSILNNKNLSTNNLINQQDIPNMIDELVEFFDMNNLNNNANEYNEDNIILNKENYNINQHMDNDNIIKNNKDQENNDKSKLSSTIKLYNGKIKVIK